MLLVLIMWVLLHNNLYQSNIRIQTLNYNKNHKYEIENLCGKGKFSLWQMWIEDLSIFCHKVLPERVFVSLL